MMRREEMDENERILSVILVLPANYLGRRVN